MSHSYESFFSTASGVDRQPYDYQERLASLPCESRLISIPTGLGKTAAVILAWLWNRIHNENPNWPRRLVYCLPMRTLVEQTRDEAKKWIESLHQKNLLHGKPPKVIILMGGEELEAQERDWDLYPEENIILIGTQDMLLSRALNRGYGMSRYRWPMHFGLLNNDCLWVLDETQLMGVGVETSAQLDGFRQTEKWLRENACPTWWMSATLEDKRLATVDHPLPANGWPRMVLEKPDQDAVQHRLRALKRLHRAAPQLSKATKDSYVKTLAQFILDRHKNDHLTLVIINRVPRAQALYDELKKQGRKDDDLALVHSRFRTPDRKKHQDLLIKGKGDRIVIATQAVEAGVDVSARVLITELAPWSSLVQRFGRCNRGGEFNAEGADIHWINLVYNDDKETAPYAVAELNAARVELEKLKGESVSPDVLSAVQVIPPPLIRPVIRRKDLIDLFDTTPDLAGHDLDISRYIREGDDTDVQVFWRDLIQTEFKPNDDTDAPARDELCRVPVHQFRDFLKKLTSDKAGPQAFIWNGLEDAWQTATTARAGAVYLIDHRAGGYHPELGWTGQTGTGKKAPPPVPPIAVIRKAKPEGYPDDPLTHQGQPLSLEIHTAHVDDELNKFFGKQGLADDWKSSLQTAAKWHDVGKALKDFQDMLKECAGDQTPDAILAKSGNRHRGAKLPPYRKHFRHELASALAWLKHHDGTDQADLIAYVIAAHHGKVRLSIRSLPEEEPPQDRPTALMARGIVDGDELPELSWDGITMPKTELRLDLMRMGNDEKGRPSWLARMIALRDTHGPFHLAYLETLLRAADMRASAKEAHPTQAPVES